MELLFESRPSLSNITGKMDFIQHKPTLHPDPVLEGNCFADGAGASIYGSVLNDGGTYRMWYQAWPEDWLNYDVALVGYAESDDGITWRKPVLNLVDHGGTRNNLCNLGFHAPSVFIDPEAPETHRYRAAGCCVPKHKGGHPQATIRGYYTAHSSDGLSWDLDSSAPTWESSDVITSIYHPGRKQGIAALKYNGRLGGFRRRSIWHATLGNGEWSQPTASLIPDEFDDVAARSRGFVSGDYYGMGMMPASLGTVGFIWQFRHRLPVAPGNMGGLFGATDITLAYQYEENACWIHMPGRPDFLKHGSVPWAPGGIYSASNITECGNEHRLYVSGATRSHGWYLDQTPAVIPERQKQLAEMGLSRIGFASWPKWRLFGFNADPEGALDIDLGPVSQPCYLMLNYETESGGSVRTELLADETLDGYSLDDATPLGGNQISANASWKSGAIIQPNDRKVSARVYLDRATIYAYELVPA